jgi:hypothetical protein
MVGFSGRIMLEGDVEGARAHLDAVMKLANTLGQWKQTQGISSVTKAYDLGGGAYAVIADLSNMRAMQIVVPPAGTSVVFPVSERTSFYPNRVGVADVVSGRVSINTLETVTETVTNNDGSVSTVVYDLLKGFVPTTPTENRYTDRFRRKRLAIEESPLFAKVGADPAIKYSQYAHVCASNYSGGMRKVVQLLFGMGYVLQPTYEEIWGATLNKPSLSEELTPVGSLTAQKTRSSFGLYDGQDVVSIRVEYDYRFPKTHGVTFDSTGVPWLIEVGTRGVHAMPLYMDPVSQTIEGQKRYKEVSPELTEFLEEFNGIPLGVNFPVLEEFTLWKNAGEVVELISGAAMGGFYGKSAFSSILGWAFNSRGTEAHNTVHDVGTGGVKRGYHYKLSINLVRATKLSALSASRGELAVKFTKLYEIKKCQRMTELEAATILMTYKLEGDTAGRKAFDELVVASNLQGTAVLTAVKTGYLYHPALFRGQPQIKFPEPIVDGLVSYDFSPAEYPFSGTAPRCDTPMFVTVIDDNVETVNYFYDPNPSPQMVAENTRGECQFTGSWTSSVTFSSGQRVCGNFYSARWDWRKELSYEESFTKYTGKKLSVQGEAKVNEFFGMCITVSTVVKFWITSTTTATSAKSLDVSVAIPFSDRTAYYMAKIESNNGTSVTESGYTEQTTGPHYELWEIYNSLWHRVAGCGKPYNGTINCIAKKVYEWDVDSCVSEDVADQFFYTLCPAVVYPNTKLTQTATWGQGILGSVVWPNIQNPRSYSTLVKPAISVTSYEIRMVNDSGLGEFVCESATVNNASMWYDTNMDGWWWRSSPDEQSGATPYMGVMSSVLGQPIVNYHTDMDQATTAHAGEPDNMHASTYACYTGVIE